MVVPSHKRITNTQPVITIGLDGNSTTIRKKFKCSVCGGTVFAYYDSLRFLLPLDVMGLDDRDLFKEAEPFDEIECMHWTMNSQGRRVRCKTLYIILRGNFSLSEHNG